MHIKINKTILIVILVGLIGLELFLISKTSLTTGISEQSLTKYATKVISECKNAPFRPSCYDREIPKLMDTISMEEAFTVTKLIQEKDVAYTYCHVLGHKLSGRETRKDPSKWKDVIARCPTTVCNNGCLHGPLLEIFNSETLSDAQIEKLIPDIKTICEPRGTWNPLPIEISMCYHGIGHLAMFMTGANINKSLSICERTTVRPNGQSQIQTCSQGVFMQIFQPLEPEDYALVKGLTPKKENIDEFCKKYNPSYFGACRSESWPLFSDDIKRPEGLIKFCSYASDEVEARRCFSAGMSSLTVFFVISQDNVSGLHDFCTGLPENQAKRCFGDASRRMINISPAYAKKAVEICNSAKKAKLDNECFNDLSSMGMFGFMADSQEFYAFCKMIPQPWQDMCLKREPIKQAI